MDLAQNGLSVLAKLQQEGRPYGPISPEIVAFCDEEGLVLPNPHLLEWVNGRPELHQTEICYLAPEAVLQSAWTEASDVFSFGIVLWECLMGQHPFQYRDDEPIEDTIRHLVFDAPLLPPGLAGRHSDRGLLALASVMLVKDPQARPFAQDLLQSIRYGNAVIEVKVSSAVPMQIPDCTAQGTEVPQIPD